jgi:hypothetical protein
MFLAIAGFILSVPIVSLAFGMLGRIIAPRVEEIPVISTFLSAIFFSPLILLYNLPGLLILILWATILGSRACLIPSVLSSTAAVLVFAYGSSLMCRSDFLGADCWGNISFQMTERSPFRGDYPLVFWSNAICTLVFWMLFLYGARKKAVISEV